MDIRLKDFATRHFRGDFSKFPAQLKKVLHHFDERRPISHNVADEYQGTLTFGQRLADRVASFGGSWTFIIIFALTLASWVLINSYVLSQPGEAFDPYPYILLNLFLSMLASIQAPVILMSQGRQALKDRIDATHDYEVNLKAELEILSLHEKLDELRENKWKDLIVLQQEQIQLLTKLLNEKKSDSV